MSTKSKLFLLSETTCFLKMQRKSDSNVLFHGAKKYDFVVEEAL